MFALILIQVQVLGSRVRGNDGILYENDIGVCMHVIRI